MNKNGKARYMCCVAGREAPRILHESIDDATSECERLARMPTNHGRRVYLLAVLGECFVEKNPPPVRWV